MEPTRTHLVQVPGVHLAHLESAAPSSPQLELVGTLDLFLCRAQGSGARSQSPIGSTSSRRVPPPPPTRPADKAPTSSLAPPPRSTSASPSSSSTPPAYSSTSPEWLVVTLTLPGDAAPCFDMPLSLVDPAHDVVAVPPSAYDLPNNVGQDPVALSLPSSSSKRPQQHGRIRLTLSRDTDPSTREQFEATLFGLYRGGSAPGSGTVTPVQTEPNALYLVDESSGRVLGQLDPAAAGGLALEEDAALAQGRTDDKPGSTASQGAKVNDVGAHEAVVISPAAAAGPGGALVGSSQTLSVKPASAYFAPAHNPNGSKIISVANTVSHGIIVGSNLLSKQFESSAGKYVASRPATDKPLVFKQTTKGAFERTSGWTETASVYSGKAAGAVGKAAGYLGDRIGKAAGLQQGGSPSGWKGTLAATLTAVNTVADHLEAGGKTLLDSGSKSASQVIHHKYGAEARGVADDVGSSVKHVALVYVDARGVTRKALLKGVGKGAIKAQLSDGSQVYLSGDGDELKQLEAAAAQGQGQIEGAPRAGGAGAMPGGSRVGAIEAAPAYEDRASGARFGEKKR
ncbi:hypothetical protein JCM9279_003189 [Rhodotorula babjevae]